MTCRELFTMATARRQSLRVHAFQQAALVWMGSEIDVSEFIERGDLAKRPTLEQAMSQELKALRDQYIDQIMTTGKLTV